MTHPANPCTPKRSKSQIQIIFLVLNCNHPTKQVIPIKIKTHARGDNGKPSPTFSGSASTTFFSCRIKGRTHVTSTLYICWAAQAGLYHHYGIPKYPLEEKMFGIFEHRVLEPFHSIFRGFDDCFYVPHSRHTEVRREDILKVPELTLLSESKEAGVYMAMARGGREFFVTGHSEYSPLTLDTEYRRDLDKGLPIEIPRNYYVDDDPEKGPLVRWRAHANLLFSNWLNYFVYQETPYNINDIK